MRRRAADDAALGDTLDQLAGEILEEVGWVAPPDPVSEEERAARRAERRAARAAAREGSGATPSAESDGDSRASEGEEAEAEEGGSGLGLGLASDDAPIRIQSEELEMIEDGAGRKIVFTPAKWS